MNEEAKTEVRNYLSAAGFFLIGGVYLLMTMNNLSGSIFPATEFAPTSSWVITAVAIGLLIVAVSLIILRKRDLLALLFFSLGFLELFWVFNTSMPWGCVVAGYIFITALLILTSPDKQKWLIFILPSAIFLFNIVNILIGYHAVFNVIIILISFYFSLCCACERFNIPGRRLLTADEQTDFKLSGSVLGYLLFAAITAAYILHYIFGEATLPIETIVPLELICETLLILVAILLFAVGKMRFTPVMFLLMALTSILAVFSSGAMMIGIGIMYLFIGLFAILRTESRILPGIMLIIYGCSAFFSTLSGGMLPNVPVVSLILNLIPCLIAVYLSFAIFSKKNLPKF